MSKKYVPDGVWLTCDKGTCMSQLKITFHERTTIYGSNLATEGDRWPFVNIKPMGMCMMTRCSCLPTPVLWRKVKEGIYINRHRLLLEDSEAQCMCGGTIRIHFTKEAAMAAAPWGSFKKPSEYIKDFFDWGMKALADGEANTKALLTKLGAPSWMMKSYEALSWGMQMNAGIVEGVLNAVVGTGELIWDIAQDPVGVGGAVVDGVCEAAGDAWEWASKGDNWKQAASDSWDYMSSPEKWKQSAQEASAWVKNNPRTLGNVAGEVLETAAEVALTAGAATTVRASAKGVQEVAEAGLKKATKELVEEGAEKAAKEAAEKAAKEVAEEAGESAAKKKLPKVITEENDQVFRRSMSERKKALMRDAKDPNSDLSDRARKFILDNKGNKVPKGYEVSHEKPLYTRRSVEGKKKLDVESNMKTQRKSAHRKRHKKCGDQYHIYGTPQHPKNPKN